MYRIVKRIVHTVTTVTWLVRLEGETTDRTPVEKEITFPASHSLTEEEVSETSNLPEQNAESSQPILDCEASPKRSGVGSRRKIMNTKYVLLILIVILAQALAACGSAAPTAPVSEPTLAPAVPTAMPEPVDPAAIAQDFYKAVNAGDIESAMALVAEDVKCRVGCYITGKEAFRSFIQGSINIGGGGRVDISDLQVEGEKVTYRWEAYNQDGSFVASGGESLQIKNGHIILMEILP